MKTGHRMRVECSSEIDVWVPSYRRPQGLARLLDSFAAQETQGEFRFGVIVVDSDTAGSARATVEAAPLPVHFSIEPERNIARARNRAFALGAAPLVACSDEEEADRRWLLHLSRALNAHSADAASGTDGAAIPGSTAELGACSGAFQLPNPATGANEGNTIDTFAPARERVEMPARGGEGHLLAELGKADTRKQFAEQRASTRLIAAAHQGLIPGAPPELRRRGFGAFTQAISRIRRQPLGTRGWRVAES